MVDVVSVDHPIEVMASVFWPPFYPLVDNKIVKDQIKDSVQQNSEGDGKQKGIFKMNRIHK
jgi:hypothetical protein